MFKDHRDIEEMALGQKARQSPCVASIPERKKREMEQRLGQPYSQGSYHICSVEQSESCSGNYR
jgi:hypothetical protein